MVHVFRRKIVIGTLLVGALFLLPTVFISAAVESKNMESVWAMRDTVIVSQPVAGDVIVAAQELRIDAPVAGDVLAIARTVVINAAVKGSVRIIGDSVTVHAPIGRALAVFGNTLVVDTGAAVGEYTWGSMTTFDLRGTFQGNVSLSGTHGDLSGKFRDLVDLDIDEEGDLHIGAAAAFDHGLSYRADAEAAIDTGAQIQGTPQFTQRPVASIFETFFSSTFLFVRLIMLFGLYIVGLIFILLVRRPTAMAMSCMLSEPAKNIGWGSLLLVVVPLACIVLFGTLIGIPLALIGIVYWGASLYIAQVFVSLAIGFVVMHRIDPHHHFHSITWTLVVGGILWTLLTMIPFIGWIIQIIGTVWAFGGMLQIQRLILQELNMTSEGVKE